MFPTPMLRAAAVAAALLPALAFAAPLSFDQALNLAVQRSQAARAGHAGSAGAMESAHAAGQLPDPMLRLGLENLPVTGPDRFSASSEPMTMKRIGIAQEWLSTDKRAARESAARAMADRESIQAAIAESDTRLQTALAYLDAWYADAALKLTTQIERLMHEDVATAQGRLAAGSAGSAEVLQLTAAQGMAEDDSEEVRQQQAVALIALQRWVGFVPDALTPVPPIDVPAEPDYLARHPLLAAQQREVEVARRAATVAAQERTPNWTWELAYGQRSGYADMVSVGVSIPLQIAPSQRQDRETAAKLALVDKAEAELAEAARAAAADYQMAASDAARLQQRIDRYRAGVALPAQQRAAAALAAYGASQGPLAALFEARRAEVEAQRKLLTLERDLAKAKTQLAFKPLAPGVHP